MAEKLTESNWTAFTKKLKLDLDDGPLTKGLAKVDKTDIAKPEPRVDALKDLIELFKKQIVALAKRKKELGDKVFAEVKDKLNDLLDVAEAELKSALAAQESQAEASADEEADSPVLLTKKMVPLLRELRKGEVRMHALICVAGKDTAVLIMRRPIASARRKLLLESLGASGGAKYITGECLLENKVLTFVVQSAAGGLAKRLRQALLDQTDMRLKVKVRGDDGEDEHGEDEQAEGSADSPGEAPDAPAVPTPGPTATPTPAADPAALAFKARLEALLPVIKAAVGSGHPSADAAKLKISEAGALSRNRDWAAANALLDDAQALLARRGTEAPAPTAPVGRSSGTVAPAIVYTQTRLAWLASRKKIQAELLKLESAILASYAGHAVLPALTQGVRKLDKVLEVFDESLADALDGALNATDPDEKKRFHDEARALIVRYEGFLKTDPVVQELDTNPFVPIAVQSTLTGTLSVLASKIV